MATEKLKWIKNGIKFTRGKYEPLVVRFDNSTVWLTTTFACSAMSFRHVVRELARTYGARSVEVKRLYDDSGALCESDVVGFFKDYDGVFRFRTELEGSEGTRRAFRYYESRELFTGAGAPDDDPVSRQA